MVFFPHKHKKCKSNLFQHALKEKEFDRNHWRCGGMSVVKTTHCLNWNNTNCVYQSTYQDILGKNDTLVDEFTFLLVVIFFSLPCFDGDEYKQIT